MNGREETDAVSGPRRQAAVAELGRQALLGVSGKGLMEQAVALVAQTLAVEGSRVLLRTREEGQPAQVIGWLAGVVEPVVFDQEDKGWLGYTLQAAEPVMVAEAAEERRFPLPGWWQAQGLRSVISVALPGPGGPYGVLAAYSRRRDGFSAEDTFFLQSVALVIAAALEREERDEAVRRSKSQLEAILHGVREGITVQAADGLLYANEAAARIIGFDSVEELLATPLAAITQRFELMDEAGRPFPLADLPGRRALMGERPEEVLLRFRYKETGEEQWSLVNATPVFGEDGRVEFVVNIFRNISERVHLYEAERLARAEAEKAHQQLAFLADASAVLATSLDYATTLKMVTELVVPRIADLCLIDLVDENGQVQRVAAAHQEPHKAKLAYELVGRFPIRLDDAGGIAATLRSGQPQLYQQVSDENLMEAARGAEHLALLRLIGLESALFVPLKARGRVFGTMSFLIVGSKRQFSEKDVPLAMELAERAALAVDNARLFQEARQLNEKLEQRVAERTQALGEANERLEAEIQMADTLATISLALSKTLDADTILATLLDEVGRLVPYDSAAVMLLGEEGEIVARAARGHEQWSSDPAVAARLSLPLEGATHLRIVLFEQRSLLIEDTQDYPGWRRLPGTEYIRNWLGVPLLIGEQAVGVLALDKARPGFFTEGQQRLAEVLVTQVAIALQNSRLFDDVRRNREQLRQLSRQVLTALEDERRRVSRELHDEAGQALTALKIGLALLRSDLPEAAEPARQQLRAFEGQVGETLEQIRQLAQALRPPALETSGLAATLESFCDEFTARTKLPVTYEGKDVPGLPEEILLSLYRFLQEALTNVLKHAQASQVRVAWGYDGQGITLSVRDDGRGFRVESLPAAATTLRGIGLLGMQERFELLGGRVWVESEPGQGSCLTAFVPWGAVGEGDMEIAATGGVVEERD